MMSHYSKQREEQLQEQADEAFNRYWEEAKGELMTLADYDSYIDGVLQGSIEERLKRLEDIIQKFEAEYAPEEQDELYYMEPEFLDFLDVLKMGADKHGNANWLNADGKKSSHKEMHDSMFHHLSNSFAGVRIDNDSGLDHLLHLASRALMMYTRLKRGIKHPNDKKEL